MGKLVVKVKIKILEIGKIKGYIFYDILLSIVVLSVSFLIILTIIININNYYDRIGQKYREYKKSQLELRIYLNEEN